MNDARKWIAQLAERGVAVSCHDGRLHVEADTGVLTADAKLWLTVHKAEMLAELTDAAVMTRLHRLADAEGIYQTLIDALQPVDLDGCHDLDNAVLTAYVRALRDTDLRERGKVPADETAVALCRSCGPIWLHPAVAAVALVVDGWPRVLGCPWCHVRNHKALPRPTVTCGGCEHFVRDTVNRGMGMGRCGAGCDPQRPWPNVRHPCGNWTPSKP